MSKIPAALQALPRWVVWRYEQRDGKPKPTKVPYDAKTGRKASSTDPATWTTFKKVVAVHDRYDGIGFVLTAGDPFVGVDLDHCRDALTEIIDPWAQAIITQLNSYTEVSPSGTGIRIFVIGTLPPVGRKKGPIEFYETERYLTVTGNHLADTPLTIEDRQAVLQQVHAVHFPPQASNGDGHRKAEPITADDETQLARMFASKHGAEIKRLYDGDWKGCEYPSQSEGDAAICCHLAFWFGRDQDRMDRLFRLSGLMREKWDSRRGETTYGAGVIANACELTKETYDATEAEVRRLASLPELEYAKVRLATAKQLGFTVAALDRAVRSAQKQTAQAEADPVLVTVVAAEDPVDGVRLADALAGMIRRFVVIEAPAVDAVVLWVLWAYAFDLWTIAPILALVSPEKRCGKTSLLELLEKLLDRSLLSSNISAAAIFRVVEAFRPTLLVDEMDSFSKEDEPLRGILNSGHTKGAAKVIRCVGEGTNMTVKMFSTWCPKILASIGTLPETLEDRSVTIPMKRRKRDERKESLRWSGSKGATLRDELKTLAGQCKRWVEDHAAELSAATPNNPDTLNDRAADNWHVLMCVANVLGGAWVARAEIAASKLSDGDLETDSIRVLLLHDIRMIFGKQLAAVTKLRSSALCAELADVVESPWATWGRGKPLTPNQLARQLKPFGVSSRNIKFQEGAKEVVNKGYAADDFKETFERYLPDPNPEPNPEPDPPKEKF